MDPITVDPAPPAASGSRRRLEEPTQPASVLGAFDEDRVAELTGLTRRQLGAWRRSGFYVPSQVTIDGRGREAWSYSFVDLLALRVIGTLRRQYNVSLQHLRDVKAQLDASTAGAAWTSTRLYVHGCKVVWWRTGDPQPEEIAAKQYLTPTLVLAEVSRDVEQFVDRLRQRKAATIGQVTRSRSIQSNAWVVAGTRVPVAAVRSLHRAGLSAPQIVEQYPTLTAKDIETALAQVDPKQAA